ncbi:Methyltransferase domain-containing protein [Halobacillus karajensis]|nr:Methyltransferase domain-containing protein [Halobacillus karajensis]
MQRILVACRMFWFDKEHEDTLYMDNRQIREELCDGRKLEVNPDLVADFRDMPFEDESFYMVVFDPPHLLKAGEGSWLAKKYGRLDELWQFDIQQGFNECMRVLKKNGTLIFKWNEDQISTK